MLCLLWLWYICIPLGLMPRGITSHETEGLQLAADALADSGLKAIFAVLAQYKRQHVTQFDLTKSHV